MNTFCMWPDCKCGYGPSGTQGKPWETCRVGLRTVRDLSPQQLDLLRWLGKEDFSQYGECHGHALNALIGKGLAKLHAPGEQQGGFIAQDHSGRKGDMYRAVSLTEDGIKALVELRSE